MVRGGRHGPFIQDYLFRFAKGRGQHIKSTALRWASGGRHPLFRHAEAVGPKMVILQLNGYSPAIFSEVAGGRLNSRSCLSAGTILRASVTFAGSIFAVMTPTSSPASASTSPQGATMSE